MTAMHPTDVELDDYADGLLDAPTMRRIEEHVAICRDCERGVRERRTLTSWTAEQRAAVRAPAELWPLVAASTIHVKAVRRQVLRSMRGLLLAGAVVLVAATAAITWRLAALASAADPSAQATPRGRGGEGGAHPGHAGHPTPAPTPPPAPRPDGPRPPR